MIRIIENQARSDQIQMLTAETKMAKALGEIRGVTRIPPPPQLQIWLAEALT